MSTEVQIYNPYTEQQIAILKQVIGSSLTNSEFAFFLEVAISTQLNPFQRQIYAIKRGKGEDAKMTIQIGIDGSRLIAERSGKYAGQLGPQWCGLDGNWRDVWLEKEPPAAARVGILRIDFKEPVWGVARYSSYKQDNNVIWSKMPDVMIAKCAEALALRKAFPAYLSGLYTREEMEQADAPDDALTIDADPPRQQPNLQATRQQVSAQHPNSAWAAHAPEPEQPPTPVKISDEVMRVRSAAKEDAAKLGITWQTITKMSAMEKYQADINTVDGINKIREWLKDPGKAIAIWRWQCGVTEPQYTAYKTQNERTDEQVYADLQVSAEQRGDMIASMKGVAA